MTATLSATERSSRGKNAARVLRREGRVPAVLYGRGDATRTLSVDALELEKLLASISAESTLIDVAVEGQSTRALIREVQWHPFRPLVLHVDFLQVHAGEPLKLDVPVRLVGTPVGVREDGGVLQQVLHELHIECLPRYIPDGIEVNVEELKIGDSVHVGDISVPNVTIHNAVDLSVCSVTPPSVAALPVEPTAEADVEPELLREPGEEVADTPTTEQGG
jgi:large subunit ribosomal protein L25